MPWAPARRHRHLEVGLGVGPQLQHGVAEGEPVGDPRDRFRRPLERHDRLEALLHHAALLVGVDPQEMGVEGELTRATAEHDATAGEVVEHHHAVEQHERVVVGQ